MPDTLHVQEIVGDATTTDRQLVLAKSLLPDAADGDGFAVSQTVTPFGYTFVAFTPGGADAVYQEVSGDADTDHAFLATDTAAIGAVEDGADYAAFSLPHAGGSSVLVMAVPTP